MTYEFVTPFLKGLYLTLNSWQGKRDKEDWKYTDPQWRRRLMEEALKQTHQDEEVMEDLENCVGDPPVMVTASPRFDADTRALDRIFAPPRIASRVNVRSRQIVLVVYGFGDASGTGLGATFTCGKGMAF